MRQIVRLGPVILFYWLAGPTHAFGQASIPYNIIAEEFVAAEQNPPIQNLKPENFIGIWKLTAHSDMVQRIEKVLGEAPDRDPKNFSERETEETTAPQSTSISFSVLNTPNGLQSRGDLRGMFGADHPVFYPQDLASNKVQLNLNPAKKGIYLLLLSKGYYKNIPGPKSHYDIFCYLKKDAAGMICQITRSATNDNFSGFHHSSWYYRFALQLP